MSKLVKEGICTCGCVEQAVRRTTEGRLFFLQGGLGYVEFDLDGDFGMRIWDEYFEDTETFAGETPTEYAVAKSWQSYTFSDKPMPEVIFDNVIRNMKDVFLKCLK